MSERPTVLVLAAKNDPQLEMLEGIPHVLVCDGASASSAAKDAPVILHWSGTRDLLRSVFLESSGLRWIHSRSAGLDAVLFPELIESNVLLTNGKGVFSQSLGEFALAAVLYFAKDFPRMLRNQRAERWEPFDVDEISGQTAGILGYGDIGRAVARRLHAMEMRLLAVKRHFPETKDPLIDEFFHPDHLHDMLAHCDHVIVTAPLTPETHHMLSDAEFGVMKRSAVVINVGRGPVIDQAAMVRALVEKKIRGAGLDVFEHEPLPPGDPLYRMENVLVSPHTADHTCDWLDQAMRFFLRQYQRFQAGEPLENVANKTLGY
jgi:phosphoglycerate dehydrogenase-like enzyme